MLLQSLVRKNNCTYDFRRKLSLALPMPESGYIRNSITNEHRASNNIVRFKKMSNIINVIGFILYIVLIIFVNA